MSRSEHALVLVGPMGAGKTSIGKRVARTLRTRFADTDALIAAAHGPIPELFAAHGEAHFRSLERDAVARAVAGGGVVSLGGGAVLDPSTRTLLAAHDVVLLTVEPRIIAGRIGGGNRPLLGDGDVEEAVARWTRIYEERRPLYDEVADLVVDTSSGPLSRVVETIAAWASTRRSATPSEQEHA
jgi:shikimate kinase